MSSEASAPSRAAPQGSSTARAAPEDTSAAASSSAADSAPQAAEAAGRGNDELTVGDLNDELLAKILAVFPQGRLGYPWMAKVLDISRATRRVWLL